MNNAGFLPMDTSAFAVASKPAKEVPELAKKRSHCVCCTKRFYALRQKSACFLCEEAFCGSCIGVWQPTDQKAPSQILCKQCIHKHLQKTAKKAALRHTASSSAISSMSRSEDSDAPERPSDTSSGSRSEDGDHFFFYPASHFPKQFPNDLSSPPLHHPRALPPVAPTKMGTSKTSTLILSPCQRIAIESKKQHLHKKHSTRPRTTCDDAASFEKRRPTAPFVVWHTS
ncbi:Aste57867_11312 [Aphanomyces stellatus]|uniref:Aste57867_11312 protein n=1 Tax=Aphanomyces stellatus TaxID=120398 RepID=A0A485KT34_9STRA|nr:hypothetical protein As57867_011270 [Aphanomyces stellatus]VFT88174.1 Aste57867_11312 [Aphanomyces stellatus]